MRIGPLYIYTGNGIFWFRIWGKGLAFRNKNHKNFYGKFSERMGKSKYLDLLSFRITLLK